MSESFLIVKLNICFRNLKAIWMLKGRPKPALLCCRGPCAAKGSQCSTTDCSLFSGIFECVLAALEQLAFWH